MVATGRGVLLSSRAIARGPPHLAVPVSWLFWTIAIQQMDIPTASQANLSDMETRKKTREQAWSVGSWADTVQEVSPCHILALQSLLSDRQARPDHEVCHPCSL